MHPFGRSRDIGASAMLPSMPWLEIGVIVMGVVGFWLLDVYARALEKL